MIPIRVPVYSMALLAVGFLVGSIAGSIIIGDPMSLGLPLGGVGSLAGYVIWMRRRLSAIRNDGKSFHLGSVINVMMCTTVAVGVGIALVGIALIPFVDIDGAPFWIIVVSINIFAVSLHWRAAQQAGTTRWFPTAREIGKETVRTLLAEGPLVVVTKSVFEVGTEAVKGVRRVGQH
jgi:hypothetical protein